MEATSSQHKLGQLCKSSIKSTAAIILLALLACLPLSKLLFSRTAETSYTSTSELDIKANVLASITNLTQSANPLAIKENETEQNKPNGENAVEGGAAATFHLCERENITVPDHVSGKDRSIPIHYQCRGVQYVNFTNQMLDYAETRSFKMRHILWGKRISPIPAGKTILITGNSHTRQTLHTLFCEYANQLISVQTLGEKDFNTMAFRLANNATIVLSTNSPVAYLNEWHVLLQQLTNISTSEYDAIVLGRHNTYTPNANSSNFNRGVDSYFKQNQHIYGDSARQKNNRGPSISETARWYAKPILVLPMFAKYDNHNEDPAKGQQKKLFNRTNIIMLNGRTHINVLGECGTDGPNEIGNCLMAGDPSPYGREAENMHRCTGPRGGHADLLAWDLIEELHKHLT
jgi:hypothetical protein